MANCPGVYRSGKEIAQTIVAVEACPSSALQRRNRSRIRQIGGLLRISNDKRAWFSGTRLDV
jgi:hypothetical protein